jgi:phospholipid transport system substrate-binding protein
MTMPAGRAARTSRRLLLAMAASAAVTVPFAASAQSKADDAEAFIRDLARQAVALSGGRRDAAELEALLDRSADTELVARLVLGRHWRTADAERRARYVELFRGYVLAGLARRLGGVGGVERVDVSGSRATRSGDTVVATDIVLGSDPGPVGVEWRVRRSGDGSLRIIDVAVEGVSLVVTNRNEFDAIVSRSGMDGLLRQLEAWSRQAPESRPSA